MSEDIYYKEDIGNDILPFLVVLTICVAGFAVFIFLIFFSPLKLVRDKLILPGIIMMGLLTSSLILEYKVTIGKKNQIGEDYIWIGGRKYDIDNIAQVELVDETFRQTDMPILAYIIFKNRKLSNLYQTEMTIMGGKDGPLKRPRRFFKAMREIGLRIVDKR